MLRMKSPKLDKWFRLYVKALLKPSKYPFFLSDIVAGVGEEGLKAIQKRYEEISQAEQIFGKKKERKTKCTNK